MIDTGIAPSSCASAADSNADDLGVDSQILAVQERQTLLCREAAADLFLGHEAPPDQHLTEALAALHAGGKSFFELALLDEAAAVQDGAERQAAQVISTGLLARREGFGRRGRPWLRGQLPRPGAGLRRAARAKSGPAAP